MLFRDRTDAGRQLTAKLSHLAGQPGLLVLALPRGGVPVGFEVARELRAELDVFIVRKLGAPGHEELALGAIASGGVRVVDWELVRSLGVSEEALDAVTQAEQRELARRETLYRGERPPVDASGRTVMLVDDGLATGASMRAAALALRQQQPARLIVAAPVGAQPSCEQIRDDADEVVCVYMPRTFYAVGQWYADFSQTTDEEVRDLLLRAREWSPKRAA